MKRRLGVLTTLLLASLALALPLTGGGCVEAKTAGALMLAFNTDLSVPKDIKAVGLYITRNGQPIHADTYPAVEANGKYLVRFPSTFAVVSNGEASGPVKIQFVAFKKATPADPYIMRESVTTVPTTRIAMLRMPLNFIDQGHVFNSSQLTTKSSDKLSVNSSGESTGGLSILASVPTLGDPLTSDCTGENQGIVDGVCDSIYVDSATLPDYDPKLVFGSGNELGEGSSCFDAAQCMQSAVTVALDNNECTVSGTPDLERVNVALETSDGQGVCVPGGGPCYVVLDKAGANGKGGWRIQNGKIVLPKGVCTAEVQKAIKSIFTSANCLPKVAEIPVCGPWSLEKATPVSVVDAGPPVTPPRDATVEPDGQVPEDGGDIRDAALDGRLTLDARTDPPAMDVGPGEMNPTSISIFQNQVYVACEKGKVVRFNEDGSGVSVVVNSGGAQPNDIYRIAVVPNASQKPVVFLTQETSIASLGRAELFSDFTAANTSGFGMQIQFALANGSIISSADVYGLSAGSTRIVFLARGNTADQLFQTGLTFTNIAGPTFAQGPNFGRPASGPQAEATAVYTQGTQYIFTYLTQAGDAQIDRCSGSCTGITPGGTGTILGGFPGTDKLWFTGVAATPDYIYVLAARNPNSTPGAGKPPGVYRFMNTLSGLGAQDLGFFYPADLASTRNEVFNQIEVSATHVFFTSQSAVTAINHSSKVATVLADAQTRPRALALNSAGAAFWTVLNQPGQLGRVRRSLVNPQ
jgi:hypothetical protein